MFGVLHFCTVYIHSQAIDITHADCARAADAGSEPLARLGCRLPVSAGCRAGLHLSFKPKCKLQMVTTVKAQQARHDVAARHCFRPSWHRHLGPATLAAALFMVAVALWKLVLGTDGPTRLEKVLLAVLYKLSYGLSSSVTIAPVEEHI